MTTTQQLVPIGMTPDEGARFALGGVSRPTIYSLVKRGELCHVNVGRRGFITAASIDAYIERLTAKRAPVSAA
ncbi:helix-turn-helix domain-containing protein [Mycobacterium sp.]|uniref:helix-turn-helix domain-containing protein n=1 Tax=Mycobacterium sp. TaxID=1785 RepID=UPI001218916D|nr:helix-turn-helix domain-containing protein [Mycobacterium sp.]TAM68292.1 MAG: DNA-binding protein [Mycobacterium sp.]